MKLATNYVGFKLRTPLVPSAPLVTEAITGATEVVVTGASKSEPKTVMPEVVSKMMDR